MGRAGAAARPVQALTCAHVPIRARPRAQASLLDTVVVLPEHPLVTGVTCTATTLTLALSDAGAAESWAAGHTVMASAAAPWLCPDPATGEVRPFVRQVTAVREVHVAPRVVGAPAFHYDAHADTDEGFAYSLAFAGRAATFVYDTVDVPAFAAFKHLDFALVRTPPRALSLLADIHAENATLAHELRLAVDEMVRNPAAFSANGTVPLPTALARRLGLSDDHARRLGFWSSATSIVSSVCSSCGSAMRAVGSIASAVVNDGKWVLDGSKQYALLDWSESTDYYNQGGARVWCHDCRAYVGGGFTAVARFKWAELQSAELSAGGSATFSFGIRGTYTQSCVTFSRDYPSAYRQVASFTVPIFGIPVRFDISGRLVATIAFKGTGTASFRTPSASLSGNVRMGVEYASGWRAIQTFSASRSFQPASWRVTGAVEVTMTPNIDIRLSIWGRWDHVLRLSPSLIFRAMNRVPTSCVTTISSDASNVARCRNQVWADVSYSASMSLTIGGLSVSVSMFGRSITVSVPGLPRTFSSTLVSPTLLTGTCLPIPTSGRLLQAPATSCAAEGCTYTAGAWSVCPVMCGVGLQTRLVGCATASGEPLEVGRCAATPGLTAPAASQNCEVACAHAGYVFGSAGTNFSLPSAVFTLPMRGLVIGQRSRYGRTYPLTLYTPVYMEGVKPGLFAGVVSVPPSNGDVDISLSVNGGAEVLSEKWGPVADSITSTRDTGLASDVPITISVTTWSPNSAMAGLGFNAIPANNTDHHVKIIPVRGG
jgi:hypothetical protein